MAKIVEKYVRKGEKLYIEGRIRYRNYSDQQGRRHNVTEIIVSNMEMLSGHSESSAAQKQTTSETKASEGDQMKDDTAKKLPF